jgi:2-dehydropantoate 2-reductase
MRYIVIGAGAVGGGIGALLTEAGRDVVLVARGGHLAALQRDGLRLATPSGERTLRIPAVGGPDAVQLTPDDVLVLAVKSQNTQDMLAAWSQRPVAGAAVAGDVLPVVCAQNGVENERAALRLFRHVVGMALWMPATHLEPGKVAIHGAPVPGIMPLGRYPSGTSGTIERIAADLVAAGFAAPVMPEISRWKYAKLLANLANAIEAVCGAGRDGDLGELRRLAVAEGRAVLAAAGIAVAGRDELDPVVGRLRVATVPGQEERGSSTWQSLTRAAGSVEVDYLNGEIVLLGRLHDVPTPVNALLQQLADQAAAAGKPPGSRAAAGVLEELSVAASTVGAAPTS